MLPDRESRSVEPSQFERDRQEFIKYFDDAEFGSAKYQAFFDCYRLDRLDEDRERIVDDVSHEVESKGLVWSEVYYGSNLRVVETKIALLETQMQQKEVTIPGYEDARIVISGGVEGSTEIKGNTGTGWDDIISTVMDNLYRKNRK